MIPVYEPRKSGSEDRYLDRCVETNWFSSEGQFISGFEDSFSDFCGTRHGVSVSSGTAALHLALESLGIGDGDEVIVPAYTMIATVNAVKYTGAEPMLVDVEPGTGNMDPEKLEEKITEDTDAIIPVHIYGHPAEMDRITDIAGEHDAYVVEDAAEAHGAEHRGRKAGSIGDAGCFSFYGNKMITTGEGGMITTDDREIRQKAVKLRKQAFGEDKHFVHEEQGFNYCMSNMEAAVGVAQMEIIEENIELKRELAERYNERFEELPGVETPVEKDYAKNVYWMYALRLQDVPTGEFRERLSDAGIETRPGFTALNLQPVYSDEFSGEYPVAESWGENTVLLPSSPGLEEAEFNHVADTVEEVVRELI